MQRDTQIERKREKRERHTHTHTHKERERERKRKERDREREKHIDNNNIVKYRQFEYRNDRMEKSEKRQNIFHRKLNF